jgi:hypothetical protein
MRNLLLLFFFASFAPSWFNFCGIVAALDGLMMHGGLLMVQGARNLFGPRGWRSRSRTEETVEAEPGVLDAETLFAQYGEATEPEPLLAPQGVEREQWRGYVLICVNANVVQVCDSVKERLGERFRGMSLVTGIYDLIVRVEADTKEQFKETLILIRETPGVTSSVTLLDLD